MNCTQLSKSVTLLVVFNKHGALTSSQGSRSCERSVGTQVASPRRILGQIVLSLGQSFDKQKLSDFLEKADTNGNGIIDFPEFLACMTHRIEVSRPTLKIIGIPYIMSFRTAFLSLRVTAQARNSVWSCFLGKAHVRISEILQ